jgi:hypothetical protein
LKKIERNKSDKSISFNILLDLMDMTKKRNINLLSNESESGLHTSSALFNLNSLKYSTLKIRARDLSSLTIVKPTIDEPSLDGVWEFPSDCDLLVAHCQLATVSCNGWLCLGNFTKTSSGVMGAVRRLEQTAAKRSVVVAGKNKKTIREFLPISEKTRTQ